MTFEEELRLHGRFIYTNEGFSMWPLLRPGRDVLEITARSAPLKKYDVVLFRDRERYVLHRVMRIRADGSCDLLGDHNTRFERGIRDEQILGVLTAVVRDGKNRVNLKALSYRAYVTLWCRPYPVRIAVLRLLNLAKSLYRRLLRRSYDTPPQ